MLKFARKLVSCERNYWHIHFKKREGKSRATLRLTSQERVCGAARAVLQSVGQGRGVKRARARNVRETGAGSSVKSWGSSPYQTAEGRHENTAGEKLEGEMLLPGELCWQKIWNRLALSVEWEVRDEIQWSLNGPDRSPRWVETAWTVETDSVQRVGNEEDGRGWIVSAEHQKCTHPGEVIIFTGKM